MVRTLSYRDNASRCHVSRLFPCFTWSVFSHNTALNSITVLLFKTVSCGHAYDRWGVRVFLDASDLQLATNTGRKYRVTLLKIKMTSIWDVMLIVSKLGSWTAQQYKDSLNQDKNTWQVCRPRRNNYKKFKVQNVIVDLIARGPCWMNEQPTQLQVTDGR